MASKRRERGLWEFFLEDPEKAEAETWGGRGPGINRRGFLKNSATALGAVLGTGIPFIDSSPTGWIPAALAETNEPFEIPGKNGLVLLNDRPINAETPPHLLDDAVTPFDRHFVRNNGLPPVLDKSDIEQWVLTVDGEVHKPLSLSLEQLKKFKTITQQVVVECGGNGRAGFYPPAKGNQWTFGAVACPSYTGARLMDVLKEAGVKPSAVYTGYYGKDTHLSGDPSRIPISRGTPIAKAMDPHTMIAWEMNGKPIPELHGYPLRLVTPGWPGSTSIKWLHRIWIRDREHDGPKMTGHAYRLPRYPVEPGQEVPDKDMEIIESMPVKSMITFPKTQLAHQKGKPLEVRGHAWAGDLTVKAVDVSIDFGRTWIAAQLSDPATPCAWQHWKAQVHFPVGGYYEVWARATDSKGTMQPMVAPGWNPKGYLNNAMHRIAVRVA
ncbi:MAG: sulfite oxidase [Nitrospina sp.]|nr:sulfite oxidase [Nitrospina sp.]